SETSKLPSRPTATPSGSPNAPPDAATLTNAPVASSYSRTLCVFWLETNRPIAPSVVAHAFNEAHRCTLLTRLILSCEEPHVRDMVIDRAGEELLASRYYISSPLTGAVASSEGALGLTGGVGTNAPRRGSAGGFTWVEDTGLDLVFWGCFADCLGSDRL